MNKAEKNQIFRMFQSRYYDEAISGLAYDAAEAVHNNAHAALDLDHICAFLRYQCIYMNGGIDQQELDNSWEFLKHVIVLQYSDPKYIRQPEGWKAA